ncbi:MAG: DJ-1/PfpI family protein [Spirochaetes bacterium]|jgi:4-methyl-5(b-hydroxyethyl)-thiazole monophosphate biosynthesis|nr:DJ-1/PfpI family protein [Spirochaetota bacterium]
MKCAVLLAEGFEEIETVTSVNMLRRAQMSVDIVSIGGGMVKGARGITIQSDLLIDNANTSTYDCVVCPGGLPGSDNLMNDDRVIGFVRHLYDRRSVVAAICAAPRVLFRARLLKDKRATCSPGTEKLFDDTVTFTGESCTVDGNIVTADAAGSAMLFSLEIIALLAGRDKSEALRKAVRYQL